MTSDPIQPAVIRITDLKKQYKVGTEMIHALAGVSLTIRAREYVAIMGASGSGKSTLMNILGCLDRPTSGVYELDGQAVNSLGAGAMAQVRNRRIGFVFQSFELLPRLSALKNVELPLIYAPAHLPRAQRAALARQSLELLGLAERERNTPGQLSGGQQQRVAIARALINSPSVLLADEPTGNLDTRTSHEIMDTLVKLNRERGLTIVLVTHESDIAGYADRIITMSDGRIQSDKRNDAPVAGAKPAGGATPRTPATPAGLADGADRLAGSLAFAMMIVTAAMQAIFRNKMRSMLTMLGVFIGVAALIAMVDVGQGANDAVQKQIASLGTNLLVVLPGAVTSGGARSGSGSASTLTVTDAAAIQRDDRAIGQVSYLIRQSGQILYGNQNWTTSIQGVTPNYPPITNWQIAFGRGISQADEDDSALVALIGQTVWHQLFGQFANPVGATLIVKGTPLRVIGVLSSKGQSSYGTDQDDLVMIPFTTAERKVLGAAAPSQATQANALYGTITNPYGIQPRLTGFVNQIYIQAATQDQVQAAMEQLTHTLAARHHIRPGDPNDFSVRNLSQIASTAQGSSQTLSYLLAAVASISLLVGGIGIMNILLVSVTERTREIGLRMAIGARRLHVLLQFLTEAVLLSVVGGVTGILGGLAASEAISIIAGWPTPIVWSAIGGGFLFSALVGMFFGYYPARKAAHFDPIEALRFE